MVNTSIAWLSPRQFHLDTLHLAHVSHRRVELWYSNYKLTDGTPPSALQVGA